jgi:hypothetical protein
VAELLESTGAISPAGEDALEAPSEPDGARRSFGRSRSSPLFEEVLDELAALSSELDVALRNFGRSESLPLLEESSEPEQARRNWGRSPDVGVPEVLLAALVEEGLVMGRVGSSVA